MTNINGGHSWEPCFVINDVDLPTGYYIGFTATTGDLAGMLYLLDLFMLHSPSQIIMILFQSNFTMLRVRTHQLLPKLMLTIKSLRYNCCFTATHPFTLSLSLFFPITIGT